MRKNDRYTVIGGNGTKKTHSRTPLLRRWGEDRDANFHEIFHRVNFADIFIGNFNVNFVKFIRMKCHLHSVDMIAPINSEQ